LRRPWKSKTFSALNLAGLRHGFSTRSQGSLENLEAELFGSFTSAGFPMDVAVQAEQPHGNRVEAVNAPWAMRVPGVDALTTSAPRLPLVIRVADCGPVYFTTPSSA